MSTSEPAPREDAVHLAIECRVCGDWKITEVLADAQRWLATHEHSRVSASEGSHAWRRPSSRQSDDPAQSVEQVVCIDCGARQTHRVCAACFARRPDDTAPEVTVHGMDPEGICPTFYDGCNCPVEVT